MRFSHRSEGGSASRNLTFLTICLFIVATLLWWCSAQKPARSEPPVGPAWRVAEPQVGANAALPVDDVERVEAAGIASRGTYGLRVVDESGGGLPTAVVRA